MRLLLVNKELPCSLKDGKRFGKKFRTSLTSDSSKTVKAEPTFQYAVFGKTGLRVCRIGFGSSYGVSSRSLEWAFERGANYFYWGSLRLQGMRHAIHHISRKSREKLVVAVQSYARTPVLVERSVDAALKALSLDYADVLLLGWWQRRPFPWILHEARRVQEKGKIRYLGLSTHHRPFAARLLKEDALDLLHVRYNAAHRGYEKEVQPFARPDGPGIVAFTATRWKTLLQRPRGLPPSVPVPTATDCYRFVLSNPTIHICLAGPASHREVEQAMAALSKGPMDKKELAWMRKVGDLVHRENKRPSLFLTAVTAMDAWFQHSKETKV